MGGREIFAYFCSNHTDLYGDRSHNSKSEIEHQQVASRKHGTAGNSRDGVGINVEKLVHLYDTFPELIKLQQNVNESGTENMHIN